MGKMNYSKSRKLRRGSISIKDEGKPDAADRWLAKNEHKRQRIAAEERRKMTKPVISRAELEKLRTPKGGFRKADLVKLGVKWPLEKGWLKKLVGYEPFVNTLPKPVLPYGNYVFREGKPDFCYHIKTPDGTLCNMQNSIAYNKLDAVSQEPPPGRRLCSICEAAQANMEADSGIPWERLELW